MTRLRSGRMCGGSNWADECCAHFQQLVLPTYLSPGKPGRPKPSNTPNALQHWQTLWRQETHAARRSDLQLLDADRPTSTRDPRT